ncbi:MAG TPA: class I SAM-dependent methyltransferase [Rhizomicrobium sp.]
MSNSCGLCNEPSLDQVYSPERSTRGITVYLCRHCGLVQSLPRIDRAPRKGAAVSSGADWGNVRYGKGFRTKAVLDAIRRHTDLSAQISLLDVGSNRGSFARAFLDAAPQARFTAVEPDERVVNSCADFERTELIHARIEAAHLGANRFDIVHSCHTIEHLADPAAVLADHWRTLKRDGLLIIDAPSIAFLGSDDVVEEWFIDKHLFHFSPRTLARMIEMAGFEIIEGPDRNDRENLLIVARKVTTPPPSFGHDHREAERAEDLITTYVTTRARNLMALTAVAADIASMKSRRVAMWGAGRIFDSLVVHGKFDARALTLLIDKHLKPLVPERHGCEVHAPEALESADAGVIVIMSRSFAPEIADEARRLAPSAEILLYSDLLAQARTRMAA